MTETSRTSDGGEQRTDHQHSPGDWVLDAEQQRRDARPAIVIQLHERRADEFVFDELGTTVADVNSDPELEGGGWPGRYPYPMRDRVVSVASVEAMDSHYGSTWRTWAQVEFTERRRAYEKRRGLESIERKCYTYPQSRLIPIRR